MSNGCDRIHARLWPMHVGHRHSAIESNDRGIVKFHQPVIQRKYLGPIGALIIFGRTVACSDACLNMEFGDLVSAG